MTNTDTNNILDSQPLDEKTLEQHKLSSDSQQLDKQLCHRLYITSNAITRSYRPLLQSINLTYPQYVVMMALWQQDDITIGELHKKTVIDMGCLSLMLKKMVDKDILQLVTDSVDRRAKRVQLTKAGIALQAKAQNERCKLQEQYQGILEDAELAQLLHLLDKLKDGLL